MPYDFQFPNEVLETHVEASKTILYFSRYLVDAPPTAVYFLSGPECNGQFLADAKPFGWRYFDRRRLGGYFDIEASDPPELSQVVHGGSWVVAFQDKLQSFMEAANAAAETVAVRIVEIPSLSIEAIWHMVDGETVAFHVPHESDTQFKEMSPSEFYGMIGKEHSAMAARYDASPHPEPMGG